MAADSKIQWTTHTWSPWRGCTKVSEGCANCYAEALSHRNPAVLGEWGLQGKRALPADSSYRQLLIWNRAAAKAGERHRVFPSLCDPFENRADLDAPLGRFLEIIARTPHLDYLWLTKRPELATARLHEVVRNYHGGEYENARGLPTGDMIASAWLDGEAPPNIWLGTSIESAKYLHRTDSLKCIPARILFLSLEPLLGPLPTLGEHLDGIDWVIVGGESGRGARPCDLAWIRSIRDQCRGAGVPLFVKQWGSRPFDSQIRISIDGPGSHAVEIDLADPKGGDPGEWPEDLRVREFPTLEIAA